MHISQHGIEFIGGFEGFSSCPYWDSYGGVWTRGYGETSGTGTFIGPGSRCISRAEGLQRLRDIFETHYAWSINDLNVPLTQNQFDALGSFVWNLGTGSMGWNVGRSLRARNYRQAADELLGYDTAGGVYLPGLARRRAAERALFLSGGSVPSTPPHNTDWYPKEEANWIHEYDKLVRENRAKSRRIYLRKLMADRRQAIWRVATHQKNGWNILNRYRRYQSLKARTR